MRKGFRKLKRNYLENLIISCIRQWLKGGLFIKKWKKVSVENDKFGKNK